MSSEEAPSSASGPLVITVQMRYDGGVVSMPPGPLTFPQSSPVASG